MTNTASKDNAEESGQEDFTNSFVDPIALSNVLIDVAERAQPLLKDFFEKHNFDLNETTLDPLHAREAYMEFLQKLWSDPQKITQMQLQYWEDWMKLCQENAVRFLGGESEESFTPGLDDRRFKADAWQDSAIFHFIMQSYIMTSQWIEKIVDQTGGLDDETKKKVDFSTKQFINAIAPTNFLMTNPEVLQETINTKGENLLRGLENLIEDMERGKGQLRISTTDYDAFEVGKNLATTKGKVIYQNNLMQLIQYEAVSKDVYKTPLLIVPPWINKFYILDLQESNSFIKWLTEQGHTVFTISWVNPDRELAQKRFEDYMEEGVLEAMDQVKLITGENSCNMIGYCLGGTLLAMTLGWLAAKGQDERIASTTFLTTLIDFEKSGDMKLFLDDAQIQSLNKEMDEKGFLDANHMRKTFSLLRSNDMIWSFVINNYLMGREPFPFDLLYWNDDATNMPAAMHRFYLRQLYGDNLLVKRGGVSMKDVPIDITKVKTPCYFLSTKEDHIAPWQATYAATQLLGGKNKFTLAASGHVAGVINPPHKNKYCYWSFDETPKTAEQWFSSAKSTEGSWWPNWQQWVSEFAGDKIDARVIGGGKLKPIEDAPGSYVKEKAD